MEDQIWSIKINKYKIKSKLSILAMTPYPLSSAAGYEFEAVRETFKSLKSSTRYQSHELIININMTSFPSNNYSKLEIRII